MPQRVTIELSTPRESKEHSNSNVNTTLDTEHMIQNPGNYRYIKPRKEKVMKFDPIKNYNVFNQN